MHASSGTHARYSSRRPPTYCWQCHRHRHRHSTLPAYLGSTSPSSSLVPNVSRIHLLRSREKTDGRIEGGRGGLRSLQGWDCDRSSVRCLKLETTAQYRETEDHSFNRIYPSLCMFVFVLPEMLVWNISGQWPLPTSRTGSTLQLSVLPSLSLPTIVFQPSS